MEPTKKFQRIRKGAIVGGVCTGLSQYFNIDLTLVRLIFLALILAGGAGGLLYILLWLFLPYDTKGSGVSLLKAIIFIILGVFGFVLVLSLIQSLSNRF